MIIKLITVTTFFVICDPFNFKKVNHHLNEERAIVSEIAGTTRDVIEEKIVINGLMFRLIDTADKSELVIGRKTID